MLYMRPKPNIIKRYCIIYISTVKALNNIKTFSFFYMFCSLLLLLLLLFRVCREASQSIWEKMFSIQTRVGGRNWKKRTRRANVIRMKNTTPPPPTQNISNSKYSESNAQNNQQPTTTTQQQQKLPHYIISRSLLYSRSSSSSYI